MEPKDVLLKVAGFLGILGIVGLKFLFDKQQEEQSQQLTPRKQSRQYDPTPPSSTVQTPPDKISTEQRIEKCLVLVISATQAEFLKSLQAKKRIDMSDGERLYEITKYLWLGSKKDLNQRKASINQYSVSEGEQSEEYDICLVYIELNQSGKGFEPNADQLDRYDAFRKLDDWTVNLTISRRLQMEAYENFEVYNR